MLDSDQVQKVRLVLQTSGWNDVMLPAILRRGKSAIEALCLAPAERSGEFKALTDEDLRARIRECQWMAACWPNEVTVFDANRARDELAGPVPSAANP